MTRGKTTEKHTFTSWNFDVNKLYKFLQENINKERFRADFDYETGYYDEVEMQSLIFSWERDETDSEYKERLKRQEKYKDRKKNQL